MLGGATQDGGTEKRVGSEVQRGRCRAQPWKRADEHPRRDGDGQPRCGDVNTIAFAHGGCSHEDDDLGNQCSTLEWLEASRLVYSAIHRWSVALGAPVPVALALFGGYRRDNPDFVLRLHTADLAIALDTLAGTRFAFDPEVG